MYGVFAYIYHKNQPNVGKCTIHGSYGYEIKSFNLIFPTKYASSPKSLVTLASGCVSFLGDRSTFRRWLLGEDLRIVRNTLGLLSFRASPMEKQSSLGRFG